MVKAISIGLSIAALVAVVLLLSNKKIDVNTKHEVKLKTTIPSSKETKMCSAPTNTAAEDLITWLPGWSQGEFPSCQYSGYIKVNNVDEYEYMVHYYLIESEIDPIQDPLIVWTNGGPGASSMFGMMTEIGPFLLNEDSMTTEEYKRTGVPTLFRNKYSWTKMGSIVIFDWPPPVGFSYCNGNVTGDGTSCGEWDDTRMAKVSFAALEGLLEERFPNFLNNDLYLTGESYAGIYVPKLAQQILNNFKPWKFRGLAVGDGCVGTDVVCGPSLGIDTFGPWFDYLFLYGHGQFSMKLWDELIQYCGTDHLKYATKPAIDLQKCFIAQKKVSVQVGGYFEYNLYDTCTYSNDFKIVNRMNRFPTAFEREHVLPMKGAINDYKCGGGNAQTEWTNHPIVRNALHVDLNSNFFSGDNGVGMVYHLTEKSLLSFYHHIISNSGLRVMIYNGDTDPGLNTFVAQNWTSSLNIPLQKDWEPWTTDNCQYMGGYITRYQNDFNFVTVRGAGHMVPNNKPMVTFEMMRNFFGGLEFKGFNSSCSSPPFAGELL